MAAKRRPVAPSRSKPGQTADLRAAIRLYRAVRDLVASLTRDGGAFEPSTWMGRLCDETAHLFGARKVSIWLYDRAAQQVVLSASSPRGRLGARVVAPGSNSPAQEGLRKPRAWLSRASEWVPRAEGLVVAVPLKAQRRTVGTMVLQDVRWRPERHAGLLDHLDALGRQVANLVDGAQLLNDVLRTRERLAHSEALSQLVAGIAHELNNPLQAVLGHLELLRYTGYVPEGASSSFRLVYREAERAARIIKNLLLLAGAGRLVLRRVSANAAIRRALKLRRPFYRASGIKVILALAADLPRVPGDPLLLQQAFHNVLLNAEQAMGTGGRIEVTSTHVPGQPSVTVTIRDTGPGIPDTVLPRVFDPFFTTKTTGSGLGLPTTRRIIREHDGEISAATHPEGGAVFTVRLPAVSVVK